MTFQYGAQLDQNYFRVFTLHPGGKYDSLQGTLETYPLNASIRYEALSYVWGPPDRNKLMRCNGQYFNITDSLDAALRRLRLPLLGRHLWVDQICIDQTCIKERSEQVSIMRHIYSNAAIVNIWLGPVDLEVAASAAGIISTLASLSYHSVERDRFPEDQDLQSLGLPTRDSPAWDALNTMFELPYFERIWIIQEIAVASSFSILWGDIEISKSIFENFRNAAIRYRLSMGELERDCPQLLWNVIALEFMKDYQIGRYDLFELVALASNSQATDKRDKIFALIGISGDQTYSTAPDYDKTDADVFAEFAKNVIMVTGKLNILDYSYVEDPDCAEDFPLWAPRWEPRVLQKFDDYNFRAAKNTVVALEPSFDTKILRLGGLQVDVIQHAVDPEATALMAASKILTHHGASLSDMYGAEIIRPIVMTMIAGRDKCGYKTANPKRLDDDTYLDGFIAYATGQFMTSCLSESSSEEDLRGILSLLRLAMDVRAPAIQYEPYEEPPLSLDFLRDLLVRLYPSDREAVSLNLDMINMLPRSYTQLAARFMQNIEISYGRRFFITEKGFVGVGPHSMKAGDMVCIFFGGPTPYIVRPSSTAEDKHIFLGSTYIHGMMDGEVIEAWEREEETGFDNRQFREKLFTLL